MVCEEVLSAKITGPGAEERKDSVSEGESGSWVEASRALGHESGEMSRAS